MFPSKLDTPQMALCAKMRYMFDTRSYADVVKGKMSESLDAALAWRAMLDVVESYERGYFHCPRMSNFFKVHIMIQGARLYRGPRFHATLEWRRLFYTCRDRMVFFYNNRAKLNTSPCRCSSLLKIPKSMSMIGKCSERTNEAALINELGKELNKLRGPHVLDLVLFMHLSRHVKLGNDLALLIFDFVNR